MIDDIKINEPFTQVMCLAPVNKALTHELSLRNLFKTTHSISALNVTGECGCV